MKIGIGVTIFDCYVLSRTPDAFDGGTWYPQACRFLNLNHHIHSPFEKSLIERTMQYIKDRTDNLMMTIFHAKRRNAN